MTLNEQFRDSTRKEAVMISGKFLATPVALNLLYKRVEEGKYEEECYGRS